MGVFDQVKEQVSVRQIMEHCGIKFNRNDMCLCPFHQDKRPSMKAKPTDRKYFCFGCGESGDAIDFVAKYYGIAPYDAAMQIAEQFGIVPDTNKRSPPKKLYREPAPEQLKEEERKHTYKVLCEYYHMLLDWEHDFPPLSMDDIDARYEEAIKNLPFTEYRLDTLLWGPDSEKDFIVEDLRKEVAELEQRVEEHRRDQRYADYDRKGNSYPMH